MLLIIFLLSFIHMFRASVDGPARYDNDRTLTRPSEGMDMSKFHFTWIVLHFFSL